MTLRVVERSMSTESPSENRLLALYRRFLGEPEGEREVYLGFALFFGGIALGAVGFLVFLWSSALSTDAGIYWQLRELAIAFAVLGLPAFVLSLVVLLPVDRRARYAAAAGAILCVAAAGVFVAAYPEHWNVRGRDYSTEGIAIYAAGLAVLAASSGAGLVGHRLERARGGSSASGRADPEAGTGAGSRTGAETDTGDGAISEEQVRRDIEEAMEETELTWGGVERDDTKRLQIDTDEEEIDTAGFDPEGANTARGSGVDDAVEGLRKLQGRDRTEGTSEGVDEQAQALQQLRERRPTEDDGEESALDRLRDRLGL